MADIQLVCPACGKTHAVSEYVEERSIACSACGQAILPPQRKSVKIGLGLKRREPSSPDEQIIRAEEPESETGAPVLPVAAERISAGTARDIRRVKADKRKVWLNGLIFIVLAGALAYIRFQAGLPGVPLEKLKLFGMLAIAAFYLLAVVLALRDNMFDGLLSIVVPLYPFYYLFFSCGNIFMRALAGALLVVFGFDLLLFLQGKAVEISGVVDHWIQHQ